MPKKKKAKRNQLWVIEVFDERWVILDLYLTYTNRKGAREEIKETRYLETLSNTGPNKYRITRYEATR